MKQGSIPKTLVRGVFVTMLLSGLITAAHGADGESQAWVQFWASANITDRVGVKLVREDRFRDSDEDKYYYGYTELGFPVKLNDHWSVAPAIRAVRALRGGEWRDDLMPQGNLMHKTALGPVTLKNRARLAKTYKEAADVDPVEYQHKTDLVLTKGWGSWNVRPYAAEEVFYDFDEHDLTRFRTYGGLLVSPVKKVSVDLYVMREDTKAAGGWTDILVFGLAGGYEF
ncbi:MAG: DUF2490 domain-containing protein [Kiritimatiellaceae bacterium]|nr:DUF2490 domain-containing protein [Kiritimatiellaceae bacterium]